ncbi:MAG: PAS domain S-box protein [Coprothermobacterota bacterium]|nr:PAS domain S-box protein [Coprothermobacterota bacterium]
MNGEKAKGSAEKPEDEELRATIISGEYAEKIIRSMPESLIVVSLDGIIVAVNSATCALLGYEEEEIVGQPIEKVVVDEQLRFKESRIENIFRIEPCQIIEKAYLSKNGRKIPVLFSSSVIRDDNGKIQGIVCVARDITERKRAEEQAQVLFRDFLNAQEAEKERICLEIHDGVIQTLVSTFQYFQALESTLTEGTSAKQLALRASSLLKQAIQESRQVINGLQPTTLRDLGLVATLRQEMRQLEQEAGLEIDFKADAIKLPADMEIGLYRIIHEAITNVRKHAYRRATDVKRIRVAIACAEDKLKVEVQDWGRGFNPDKRDLTLGSQGFGLYSMRKRAELLQGVCDIQSSPGLGTTVRVEIPLRS